MMTGGAFSMSLVLFFNGRWVSHRIFADSLHDYPDEGVSLLEALESLTARGLISYNDRFCGGVEKVGDLLIVEFQCVDRHGVLLCTLRKSYHTEGRCCKLYATGKGLRERCTCQWGTGNPLSRPLPGRSPALKSLFVDWNHNERSECQDLISHCTSETDRA